MKLVVRTFAIAVVAFGSIAAVSAAQNNKIDNKIAIGPVPTCQPGPGVTCGM